MDTFAKKRDYLHKTSYIQMWRKNYSLSACKYCLWNVNMNLLAFIHVVYLIFASINLNYEFNISSHNVCQLLPIKIQTRFRLILYFRAQQIWFIVILYVCPFASAVISKNHYWILKRVTLVSIATLLLAPRVSRNIISRDRGWNFFFLAWKM